MRRAWLVLALLLAGCSTAPVADFLDFVAPGRVTSAPPQGVGGVCAPQGGTPGAPNVPAPIVPAPPPGFPGAGGVLPPGEMLPPVNPPAPPPGGTLPPVTFPGG